jgi:hypothetical protein
MASSSFLACALATSSDLLGNRTTSVISSHLISTLATLPCARLNPAPHLYGDLARVNLQFPRFSHLAIQRKQKKHPGHPINSISTSDFTNLGAESSSSTASATNQHASSIYDASQPETPPSLRPRQRRNNKALYLACSLAVTKRQ